MARRQRPGKQELVILAWMVALCGGCLLFRWCCFARLVPNTYFTKRWWDYHAADYLRDFCQAYPVSLAVIAAGALLVSTFGSVHERRALALLLLLVAGGLSFIVLSKGEWMNECRFCAPYCGVLAMIFAAGVGACRHEGGVLRSLSAAVVVAVAFTGVYRDSKPRFELIQPHIGFRRTRSGCTRGQEDYLLTEGLPDVLDAHGQSQYLTEFRELMKHYTSYWDGSSYVLRDLTRDVDPRCPGSMAEVRALSLADFEKRVGAALDGHDGGLGIALWRCGQQHRPAATMPSAETQRELATRAEIAARAETDNLKRLRMFSLVTILSKENAQLRRTTERLRDRLRARNELPGLTPRND